MLKNGMNGEPLTGRLLPALKFSVKVRFGGNFSKVKFWALVELLPRPNGHWGLGLEERLGSPK